MNVGECFREPKPDGTATQDDSPMDQTRCIKLTSKSIQLLIPGGIKNSLVTSLVAKIC